MAEYAWVIDKDHLEDGHVGTIGPSRAPEPLIRLLKAGQGRQFKMYDGDHELYYEGRCVVDQPPGWDLQEEHFGPLWDFGEGNAGCVEIHYYHEGVGWVQL